MATVGRRACVLAAAALALGLASCAVTPGAEVEDGRRALDRGDARGAAGRFEAALALDPDEPEAVAGLCRALHRLDRPDEIARRFGDAAGAGGLLGRGAAFLAAGDTDEAERAFLEARRRYAEASRAEGEGRALILAAAAALRRGDSATAGDRLSEAIRLLADGGPAAADASLLLAEVDRARGELDAAEEAARDAEARYLAAGLEGGRAGALVELAAVRRAMGQPADEENLLRAAALASERVEDHDAVVRAALLLAESLGAQSRHHDAVAWTEEAVEAARRSPESNDLSRALVAHGLALIAVGRIDEAETTLASAVAPAERAPDMSADLRARVREGFGRIAEIDRDHPAALRAYAECAELYEAAGDPVALGRVESRTGRVLEREGRRFAAAGAYRRSATRLPDERATERRVDFARAVLGAGETTSAELVLGQALEDARRTGDAGAVAGVLVERGRVEGAMGEHAAAASSFEEAAELLAGVGEEGGRAEALLEAGRALERAGRPDLAARAAQEARLVMERIGDHYGLADALATLAAIAAGEGRSSTALDHLELASEIRLDLEDDAGLVEVRLLRARVAEDQGRVADARNGFLGARVAEERVLVHLGLTDDETPTVEPGTVGARFGRFLVRRDAAAREALDAIEEGRAASLRARLRRPAIRALEAFGTDRAARWRHGLADAGRGDALLDSGDLIPSEKAAMEEREERGQQEAAASFAEWESAILGPESDPASALEAVAQRLAPGELLLAYALAEPESIVFVVDRAGVRHHPIAGAARLAAAVERLDTALERGSSSDVARAASGLGPLLLAPAHEDLGGAARLFVVPDGFLAGVAFQALPASPGSGPLGRNLPVTHLPWAGLLPEPAGAAGDPDGGGIAVVLAGPHIDPTTDVYGVALDYLSDDRVEVTSPHAPLRPAAATEIAGEAAFKALLGPAAAPVRVLHFAATAIDDDARSAIALGGGEGEDGFLTLDEILGLDLPPSVVVLARVAEPDRPGPGDDGAMLLARAFLAVGVRAVVATHPGLPVEEATPVLAAFHRSLGAGAAVDEAAATAAALRVIGDGRFRAFPGATP